MTSIKRFLLGEDGPTSVEYAVMLALIIIVCIGTITTFGGSAGNVWSENHQELESAFSGS